MGALEQRLVAHIAQHGPIGFDEFQAHALYAPGLGFYSGGGGAGRRRDFLTSPEVGPLFGAVLARALDAWWDELGAPATFRVVEAGAGPGTLARSILAAGPRCSAGLSLTLVEVGEVQWSTHPEGVVSRADLPATGELGEGPVVVLANELLDNLPVALAERTAEGWAEVVVDVTVDAGRGERFDVDSTPTPAESMIVESHRPLLGAQVAWCHDRAPDAPVGARIPVQAEAAAWLGDALALAGPHGRVVVIDYARTTAQLAALPPDAWLRTYAAHGRGGSPLVDIGAQDITCDVAVDQLALVAEPRAVWTQAEFLRHHGIDPLVAEGDAIWARDGLAGGLAAIAAQSRRIEAEALLDPDGLGGFTVLEWSGR